MRIVIVGGGLAAGSAAAALRERGFDGEILLIGEEPHAPYDRPPLSKAFLAGPSEPTVEYKTAEEWRDLRVTLLTGARVDEIDTDANTVHVAGDAIAYGKLLLATGGRPRRLSVPGATLDGIHLLRTIDDARALRDAAASASQVVVVGMGFIGAEVAASLRTRGLSVTAIEPFATPLERVLGTSVGGSIARLHQDHGVNLRLGETVTAFNGSSGRVDGVQTASGATVECDLVVVGVGIEPNDEIARGAGIPCDNGILVDARCFTGVEDVYAAGDVARHDHPVFGRIRVEHWQNAINQGAAAAAAMLGSDEPYADVHWFWSDQYDASLQYAGHHTGETDLVVRGSLSEPPFTVFYVSDSVVQAVFGFNAGREVRRAMNVVGKAVDPAQLRDPDVDLRKV